MYGSLSMKQRLTEAERAVHALCRADSRMDRISCVASQPCDQSSILQYKAECKRFAATFALHLSSYHCAKRSAWRGEFALFWLRLDPPRDALYYSD
jgi:hypothetical protein